MKKFPVNKVFQSARVCWCVVVAIVVGVSALLGSVCLDAVNTASRVTEILQVWQDMGLCGTVAWRAREFLAQLSLPGPLRPNPPRDPLKICGVQAETSWWRLLLGARQTKRLLVCLEEQVREAENDHVAFQTQINFTFTCVLAVITFHLLVSWKSRHARSADLMTHKSDDKELLTGPEADDSVQELSIQVGGYPDNVSSDEYEECQEDNLPFSPAYSVKCTERAVSDLRHLSAAKTHNSATEAKVFQAHTKANVTKKRKRRKKTVKADLVSDSGEWQTVDRKKKKTPNEFTQKKEEEKQTNICVKEVPLTAKGQKSEDKVKKTKPSKAHRKKDSRARLRQQWREDTVQVKVEVPPKRRQHVIGPRGDTIRNLRKEYPAVRVSVPLPKDLTSRHVTLEGPKSQVAKAEQDITARLQVIDALIREAAKRRKGDNVKVLLHVEPNMRRRLVGPGGERLVRLAQEHPGVGVRVPPATDTHTRTVTLRGPPKEVAAVESCLKATL